MAAGATDRLREFSANAALVEATDVKPGKRRPCKLHTGE